MACGTVGGTFMDGTAMGVAGVDGGPAAPAERDAGPALVCAPGVGAAESGARDSAFPSASLAVELSCLGSRRPARAQASRRTLSTGAAGRRFRSRARGANWPWYRMRCANGGGMIAARRRRNSRHFATFPAPVLGLWGDHDKLTSFGQVLMNLGQIPRVRTVVVPRTGHMPMIERPAETLFHLQRFIENPPTGTP